MFKKMFAFLESLNKPSEKPTSLLVYVPEGLQVSRTHEINLNALKVQRHHYLLEPEPKSGPDWIKFFENIPVDTKIHEITVDGSAWLSEGGSRPEELFLSLLAKQMYHKPSISLVDGNVTISSSDYLMSSPKTSAKRFNAFVSDIQTRGEREKKVRTIDVGYTRNLDNNTDEKHIFTINRPWKIKEIIISFPDFPVITRDLGYFLAEREEKFMI